MLQVRKSESELEILEAEKRYADSQMSEPATAVLIEEMDTSTRIAMHNVRVMNLVNASLFGPGGVFGGAK